jgi:hypothetical protein
MGKFVDIGGRTFKSALLKNAMKTLLLGIIALGAVATSNLGYADDKEIVVCAAIHPCNPDGTVIEPFNTTDECGLKYAKECLGEKANQAISLCEDNQTSLQDEIAELNKKLTKARKTIRQLKRK